MHEPVVEPLGEGTDGGRIATKGVLRERIDLVDWDIFSHNFDSVFLSKL